MIETTVRESEMLTRVLEPVVEALNVETARVLAGIEFSRKDTDRMHELAEKNRSDELDDAEREEMDAYIRVGNFLGILQSKARRLINLNTVS